MKGERCRFDLPCAQPRIRSVMPTTEGPSWGHSRVVLGAIWSFLEPLFGHLSPKIDKVSEELTLRYPHEGPCVVRQLVPANSQSNPGCEPAAARLVVVADTDNQLLTPLHSTPFCEISQLLYAKSVNSYLRTHRGNQCTDGCEQAGAGPRHGCAGVCVSV